MTLLWLPLLAALLTVAACGAYLKLARRWQLLDHPNHRSSHSLPTPHGGGVAILLGLAAAVGVAGWFGVAWSAELLGLLGVALALMALGVLDDLVGLSVRLRFAVYALCCLAVAAFLMVPLGALAWWLLLPVGLILLWGLNLYNFMDGIDGIAPYSASWPVVPRRCWRLYIPVTGNTRCSACYWVFATWVFWCGIFPRRGCSWGTRAVCPRAFCWVPWRFWAK